MSSLIAKAIGNVSAIGVLELIKSVKIRTVWTCASRHLSVLHSSSSTRRRRGSRQIKSRKLYGKNLKTHEKKQYHFAPIPTSNTANNIQTAKKLHPAALEIDTLHHPSLNCQGAWSALPHAIALEICATAWRRTGVGGSGRTARAQPESRGQWVPLGHEPGAAVTT